MNYLDTYKPIAQAISLLFHPHVEVIIHDLKTGSIAALFNSFSKRTPGDESLIQDIQDPKKIPDVFPVYSKTNFDGRKINRSLQPFEANRVIRLGCYASTLIYPNGKS